MHDGWRLGDWWIWGLVDLPTNIGKLNGFVVIKGKLVSNFYTFLPLLNFCPRLTVF